MSKKTKNKRLQSGKQRIPVVMPPKEPKQKNGAPPAEGGEIQESLKVPAALANVIFEYMKKRPWDEAQPIIAGLLRCERLKE